MMCTASYITALTIFSVITQMAMAENSTKVDGYTIHHNAITTDALTLEVAQAYNIQRSKNRGLLTVSVLKDQSDTHGIPVKAVVKASVTNLNGQMREIGLREISESGAVYYIGDFRINNEDNLNFTLEIIPEGASSPYKASLRQEFFTE